MSLQGYLDHTKPGCLKTPAFRFLIIKKCTKTPELCFLIIEKRTKNARLIFTFLRNAGKTLAVFLNRQPHHSRCPRCPPAFPQCASSVLRGGTEVWRIGGGGVQGLLEILVPQIKVHTYVWFVDLNNVKARTPIALRSLILISRNPCKRPMGHPPPVVREKTPAVWCFYYKTPLGHARSLS